MAKQTPEGKVKAAVQKRLAEYGVLPFMKAADESGPVNGVYWMPVQGPFSVQGVHDFVICWHGVFCTLETKAPDAKEDATENQRCFQVAVNKSNGLSLTGVRSADAVDQLYELIKERRLV